MNDMTPAPKLADRRQKQGPQRESRKRGFAQSAIKRAQASMLLRARLCVTSHSQSEMSLGSLHYYF